MADIEAVIQTGLTDAATGACGTVLGPWAEIHPANHLQRPLRNNKVPVLTSIHTAETKVERSKINGASNSPTLYDAYQSYMNDPTRAWSPRTRTAHEATRSLVLSIIGPYLPIDQISRAHCREFISILQRLPRNASKKFPGVAVREIVDRNDLKIEPKDLMSVANVNVYINRFGSLLNWAVLEGFLQRNPACAMRLKEPLRRMDRRLPFSAKQLQMIFDANLYRGCLNDNQGYAKVGVEKPKGARFWIPLIGLFMGLRLNEICQLDVNDILIVQDIPCITVTNKSIHEDNDKHLKTRSSDRIVPLHHIIIDLGFIGFVAQQRRSGETKLFRSIQVDRNGFRSTAFSKWFIRFIEQSGATGVRTSFHSFRHNFRDALREAQVPRDIAHALGGWTNGGL